MTAIRTGRERHRRSIICNQLCGRNARPIYRARQASTRMYMICWQISRCNWVTCRQLRAARHARSVTRHRVNCSRSRRQAAWHRRARPWPRSRHWGYSYRLATVVACLREGDVPPVSAPGCTPLRGLIPAPSRTWQPPLPAPVSGSVNRELLQELTFALWKDVALPYPGASFRSPGKPIKRRGSCSASPVLRCSPS